MDILLRRSLGELAALDRAEQLTQLEALREGFEYSVVMLSNSESDLRYNCVMYALGLQDHADLYQLLVHLTYGADKSLDIFMDTGYLQMLIDSGHLQETHETDNCLVIYRGSDKITHIGLSVAPGRMASKWGTAHLFEHDFFESPLEYGDDVKFYAPIEREFAVNQFFEYAKAKGAHLN